jgi:hypothetical protein
MKILIAIAPGLGRLCQAKTITLKDTKAENSKAREYGFIAQTYR